MNETVADHQLIITGDGSHTLFVPALQEHYHSTFGAVAESRHVFAEAGFNEAAKRFGVINLLEVGFGTGLNALLTLILADERSIPVHYTGIEPFPLTMDQIAVMNYPAAIDHPAAAHWWKLIHASAHWNTEYAFLNGSSLLKWQGRLEDFTATDPHYHLVYFDAFGPSVQPELWDDSIFLKLAAMVVPDGILVTYSSKGAVRRALVAAGFRVEKIPGPAGKREMVRAIKNG